MSFFGFLGKRVAAKATKKKVKKKEARKKPKTTKTEGTTITYGQFFHFPNKEKETKNIASTVVSRKQYSKASNKSAAGATRVSPFVAPFISPRAPVSKLPPPAQALATLGVIKPTIKKVPQEKKIKMVCRTEDVKVGAFGRVQFPPRIKSNLAVAAASANRGATVFISKNKCQQRDVRPDSLTGNAINDIAKVAPKLEEVAVLIPSTIKSELEIKEALEEAQKVDLTITLKSQKSESIELNTLKVPMLETDFVYNFFEEDEEDIISQEDQESDPLLENRPIDTPRYNELRWDILTVTEPLTGTELEVSKNKEERNIFAERRGTVGHSSNSFRDSIEKKKKRVAPINRDGVKRKFVDIHAPEKAFKHIGNRKLFANSIPAVLNTVNSKSNVFGFPLRRGVPIQQPSSEVVDVASLPFTFPGVRKSKKVSPLLFARGRKRGSGRR